MTHVFENDCLEFSMGEAFLDIAKTLFLRSITKGLPLSHMNTSPDLYF
jgi:hypothetical protein